MTDNTTVKQIAPVADRDRTLDALISAAVLAAEETAARQADEAAEAQAASDRSDREEREKTAVRLTDILKAWAMPIPALSADDLGDLGWEVVPGLYLFPYGDAIRATNGYSGSTNLRSLADLGNAIRAHQAEQERDEELEIAEQEMEAKKPPLPTLPSVIPGSGMGTGVIFEPHGRSLTLRPFAPRDGSAGVAFAVEYISAAEARRLADALPYQGVRVGDYLAAITPPSITWLDDDGRTITVPVMANWISLCAALRSWAGYADALDAWEAECRKRGLTDY